MAGPFSDSTQALSPTDGRIVVENLKQLDTYSLNHKGNEKIIEFLKTLQEGFSRPEPVRINIPFIQDEPTERNEYDLYIRQFAYARPNTHPPSITLSHIIHLIDGLVEWTKRRYPGNDLVTDTFRDQVFHYSLLELQTVTEEWLSQTEQLRTLQSQVELLLTLYLKLDAPAGEGQGEGSLIDFIITIQQSHDERALELWKSTPQNGQTVLSIMQLFSQLDVGGLLLNGDQPIPVHQARLLANAYTDRLREVARYTKAPQLLLGSENEVRELGSDSFLFDVADPIAAKTQTEDEKIRNYIRVVDQLVTALRDEKQVADKLGEVLKAAVGGGSSGGSGATSSATTPTASGDTSPAPSTDQTTPATNQAVVPPDILPPTPDQLAAATTTDSTFTIPDNFATLPSFEQQKYRYQAISVHAAFLYNHLAGNLYNLYGLPPGKLPPSIEYQLRQDVIKYLYQLSPSQLKQLNSYGRTALGETLFRQLIISSPKLFVAVEQHIQAQAQESGVTLAVVDPLHLEDRTTGFNLVESVRNLPQTTENLPPASLNAALEAVTTPTTYDLSLAKSDESFKSGLLALGIQGLDGTKAIKIRQRIVDYIQTTGLDPEKVFNESRNPLEISALFDGLSIKPEEMKSFMVLVNSYWRYQIEKLQAITNHAIQADADLAAKATAGQLQESDLVGMIEGAQSFATTGNGAQYDTRLYALASLSTGEDLNSDSYLRRLALALFEMYGNDEAATQQAIQAIIRIQKLQAAAFREAALQFDHRQMLAWQAQVVAQAEAEVDAATQTIEVVPSGLAAFNALSLADRTQIAELLSQQTTPQDLYSLTQQFMADGGSGLYGLDGLGAASSGQAGGKSSSPSLLGRISQRFGGGDRRGGVGRAGLKAKASISRLKTLGANAGQLASLAGSANPAGLAGRLVGGLAGKVFGKDIGDKIQMAFQVGGFLAPLAGAIGSAIGFILGPALPFIAGGVALLGGAAAASAAGAAKAATAAVNSSVVQPILGGGTPAVGTPGAAGAAGAAGSTGIPAATATPGVVASLPGASVGTVATVGTVCGTAALACVVTIANHGAFLANINTDILPGEVARLAITKMATPPTGVIADQQIQYTLTVTANTDPAEGAITQITVTDTLDSAKFQLGTFQMVAPVDGVSCAINTNVISCTLPDLTGGQEVSFSYFIKTSSDASIINADGKTPIGNRADVSGTLNGETLEDSTSVTVNSDGAAIAAASFEIVSGLQKGWWEYYNFHPTYPNLFDLGTWNSFVPGTPSTYVPDGTTYDCASPQYSGTYPCISSSAPNAMFWCTWNVIYAFQNAGRPIANPNSPGALTGVTGMRTYFQNNGVYIENPTYQEIQVGDVAFFGKPGDRDAHVAIVAEISESTMVTYDSNNYRIDVTYVIGTDGRPEPLGVVLLNGVGRL